VLLGASRQEGALYHRWRDRRHHGRPPP